MYFWTESAKGNKTHVLKKRGGPPDGPYFGYATLCGEFNIPREGHHFRLTEESDEGVACSTCRDKRPQYRDIDEGEIFQWEKHLVFVERINDGEIRRATLLCGDRLDERVGYESPTEFSGDLHNIFTNICHHCWEEYEERQWRKVDKAAQIAVDVSEKGGQNRYFAKSIEAEGTYGNNATLILNSKNELQKKVPWKAVEGIVFLKDQKVVE